MSKVDELLAAEQEAHKARMAELREKKRKEDERVDREVLRWLKSEQPEKWKQFREAAEQRLVHKRKKRSALHRNVHGDSQEPQQNEHEQRVDGHSF